MKHLFKTILLLLIIILLANKSFLESFICRKSKNRFQPKPGLRYRDTCQGIKPFCSLSRRIPTGYVTVTDEMKKPVKGNYVEFDEKEYLSPPLCRIDEWVSPNELQRLRVNRQRSLVNTKTL